MKEPLVPLQRSLGGSVLLPPTDTNEPLLGGMNKGKPCEWVLVTLIFAPLPNP